MSANITGGEAILRSLIINGVDVVFGIPGIQTYAFFDAIAKYSSDVRCVTPRHEQAAAYMATGYSKVSGKPGVFSVVPGPGILNAGAAIVTAYAGNVPTLLITGQVPSSFLGQGRGHLHELKDQLATLQSMTKWSARIDNPSAAPRLVEQAFSEMLNGRRGPVSLEMCWDRMMSSSVVEWLPPFALSESPPVDTDAVEHSADILATAERPMIMVGSGAQHARQAVTELAMLLGAPVTAFRGGRGIVPADHELAVSTEAAYELWPDTDVLVGIGSRLEMPYMRWQGMSKYISTPNDSRKLIRIDIDPLEMQRLHPTVAVVADSDVGTRALISAMLRQKQATKNQLDRIQAARTRARSRIEKVTPQIPYLDVIRDVLPRNGIFVKDLCQVGYASYFGFPVYEPGTYITSSYQGTLGFGLPTALGAKIAAPDRSVVLVTGDGGFMFGLQELATAVQERIGVVIILFNNQGYGNIRRDQQRLFQGRVVAADLTTPDMLRLADSFGIRGIRVSSPQSLRPVLESALQSDDPCIIEIPIEKDSESSPWELIIHNPPSDGETSLNIA